MAVVGAGLSGIAVAARLKMAGLQAFDVFEQSDGPGGTWRDACYPGAAVDTPQPMYSFSFTKRHSFSRVFAGQPELLQYLEDTVDDLGLRSHFRFNTRVTSAEWSEEDAAYTVSFANGERRTFEVLVSAVGFLNNPRYPDWPHLSDFGGSAFHSARWRAVDLAGKRVALVGTGSAGAQIAGAIAGQVGELLVFQREPGWVLPKPDKVFSSEERANLAVPRRRRNLRRRQYIERESGGLNASGNIWGVIRPGARANIDPQRVADEYIAEVFADRPDLRELITPNYVFAGKRLIKDSTYYPALARPNVSLIPRAIDDVYDQGVIDAEGDRYEVDVIVMATGYHASEYLATLPIKGRSGSSLAEQWNGEPSAFMGMTVPGFPNLFIMYGPNTNSVHLTYLFESQAAYIERCIRRMKRGVATIEVKQRWHDVYNREIQRRVEQTSFAQAVREGVHSYYATSSGRIVGYMPIRNVTYASLLRLFGRLSTTSTSRGNFVP